MSDYFPRIGLVLQALIENSTLTAKADALRLATELQAADDNLNQVIEERVQARLDEITGRVQAVEDDHRTTKDVVFSTEFQDAVLAGVTDTAAEQKLRAVFGGVPVVEEAPAPAVTKADIVAQLSDAGVDFDPKAKKADLQAQLEELAISRAAAPGETTTEILGSAGDNALSAGSGKDTVS